jgi:ankyrin repeat protein
VGDMLLVYPKEHYYHVLGYCQIFGRTALHMASKGGHDQTVQILLENEVDTDVRDEVTP